MTDAAGSFRVYVDANPFIYFIEGEETIARRIKPFFDILKGNSNCAVTSELTLAEILAKARPDARRNYFNLIVWSNLFQLLPVTRDILIDTVDYRSVSQSTRRVNLPDAIHVVTAISARCQAFFSADAGLKLPENIELFEPNDAAVAKLVDGIR